MGSAAGFMGESRPLNSDEDLMRNDELQRRRGGESIKYADQIPSPGNGLSQQGAPILNITPSC